VLAHELEHGVQNIEGFDFGSNPDFSRRQANQYATAIRTTPEASVAREIDFDWDVARAEARPYWQAQTLNRYDRLIERGNSGTLRPRDVERQADFYEVAREIREAIGPMPRRPGPQRDQWLTAAALRMRQNYLDGLGATDRSNVLRLIEENTPREIDNAARRYERRIDRFVPGAREWRDIRERSDGFRELDARNAYFRNSGEVEARNVQSRLNMTPAERAAEAPWRTMTAPDLESQWGAEVSIPYSRQIVGNAQPGQGLPPTTRIGTIANLGRDQTLAALQAYMERVQ